MSKQKRQQMVPSKLICPDCGAIFVIQRRMGEQRKLGHTKHLYCFKCKETRGFLEIQDNVQRNNINNRILAKKSYSIRLFMLRTFRCAIFLYFGLAINSRNKKNYCRENWKKRKKRAPDESSAPSVLRKATPLLVTKSYHINFVCKVYCTVYMKFFRTSSLVSVSTPKILW